MKAFDSTTTDILIERMKNKLSDEEIFFIRALWDEYISENANKKQIEINYRDERIKNKELDELKSYNSFLIEELDQRDGLIKDKDKEISFYKPYRTHFFTLQNEYIKLEDKLKELNLYQKKLIDNYNKIWETRDINENEELKIKNESLKKEVERLNKLIQKSFN